jgi:hypothetical protein
VCVFIHCAGVHGSLHNEQCVPRHCISKKTVAFALNNSLCCELYICVRCVNSVRVMKCVDGIWHASKLLDVRTNSGYKVLFVGLFAVSLPNVKKIYVVRV